MLQIQVPGKMPKGRLKIRFMDEIKEDMKVAGVVIEDVGTDQNRKNAAFISIRKNE